MAPKQQEILKLIQRQFQQGREELTFPEIYQALGISKNNFSNYIAAVAHKLTEAGLQIRHGRPKVVVKLP